jgi:hypothetical protein
MQKKVSYSHTYYNQEEPVSSVEFDEEDESLGTRKLFQFAALLLESLDNGFPVFMDEFDSSLHPLIVESIELVPKSVILEPALAVSQPTAYQTAIFKVAVPKSDILELPQF